MTGNSLKAALAAGQVQRGIWLASGTIELAEIAGGAGFDWCLVDWEHGVNDLRSVRDQLVALKATGTHAVVRVPDAQDWMLKQVLDIGAQSVLVPMVHDADMASQVVGACRYPPGGWRGMGAALGRASDFGRDTAYADRAAEDTCIIVQAESAAAVENIDAIAGTDGIDGVFLGPADLSADMGYPGQPDHEEVVAAMEHVIARTRAAGKAAGTLAFDRSRFAAIEAAGVTMLGIGADTVILAAALSDLARHK